MLRVGNPEPVRSDNRRSTVVHDPTPLKGPPLSTRAPRRTAIQAISGVSVAILALAGCSSDDTSEDSANSSSAAADNSSESAATDDETSGSSSDEAPGGAFDKTAAEGVLLTAEELGDGYAAVPAAQLTEALNGATGPMTQALDSMQVEPAECQAVMQDMIGQMGDLAAQVDQTAIALFTKGTDFASESIAPASLLPDGALDAQAEACSDMTLTIQGVTATASMTPVDIDLGDDSTGVITNMKINAGGQEISQVSAQAIVVQGEGAVSISLSGADATEEALTEITTKAVEKAEPVLG